MRGLIVGFMLLGIILAGCIELPVPEENETGETIPNPAAENCEEKGYGYEIRTGAKGEYGVCTYAGQECEEWALYRGECCFTADDCHCSADYTKKCENQECSCVAVEPVENETEEETEPVEEEPEPEPEEETPPEHTNKTVKELINDGLEKVNSEFWKDHPSGDYTIETYTWVKGTTDIKPHEMPVGGSYVDTAVLFNGDRDMSIKGFGFKSYVPSDDSMAESRAVGVFHSDFPMIHIYEYNQMNLKIDFYPYGKSLYSCEINEKQQYLAEDDSWITIYYFICDDTDVLTS